MYNEVFNVYHYTKNQFDYKLKFILNNKKTE